MVTLKFRYAKAACAFTFFASNAKGYTSLYIRSSKVGGSLENYFPSFIEIKVLPSDFAFVLWCRFRFFCACLVLSVAYPTGVSPGVVPIRSCMKRQVQGGS